MTGGLYRRSYDGLMRNAAPDRSGAGQQRKPATIYDVARLAGVSHQTVARFLRGADNIAPERRARVERAVTELDYQPNEAARALATNQSRRIAVFAWQLGEWGPRLVLEGAARAARAAGYVLDIASLERVDGPSVREAVDVMTRVQPAGVLIAASSDRLVEALAQVDFGVPVAIEDEAPQDAATHPMSLAVEHLLGLGHERFFLVSGPEDWSAARIRRAVVLDRLAAGGARCVDEAAGDWGPGSGHHLVARIVASGATAVCCANDRMALGVLAGLRDAGVDVPGRVSVTGFDGLDDGAYYVPTLTTVLFDFRALGAAATQRLLLAVGAGDAEAVPPAASSLLVRGSTGPVTRL